ncbi:hypothetical protein SAMN04487981_107275 [Streptomyces sp. cf386]|nr:hypothetical protein SAMN04487981_107275 [Streptomyces sp. cf386]
MCRQPDAVPLLQPPHLQQRDPGDRHRGAQDEEDAQGEAESVQVTRDEIRDGHEPCRHRGEQRRQTTVRRSGAEEVPRDPVGTGDHEEAHPQPHKAEQHLPEDPEHIPDPEEHHRQERRTDEQQQQLQRPDQRLPQLPHRTGAGAPPQVEHHADRERCDEQQDDTGGGRVVQHLVEGEAALDEGVDTECRDRARDDAGLLQRVHRRVQRLRDPDRMEHRPRHMMGLQERPGVQRAPRSNSLVDSSLHTPPSDRVHDRRGSLREADDRMPPALRVPGHCRPRSSRYLATSA